MRECQISRRAFLLSSAAFGLGPSLTGRAFIEGLSAKPQSSRTVVVDRLIRSTAGAVSIGGWLGEKIDACIQRRVMAQDVQRLVEPFRELSDSDNGWRGEFWGKWFTSAVLAYHCRPTAEHRAVLDGAVHSLLSMQKASGDISTYDNAHCGGNWDVWTRKYVMLGLIAYYDATGSTEALTAATRVGETLLRDFGTGKENLQDASLNLVGGLSSCSVLEPVCLLYQRTGRPQFLNFARYIVASWEQPSRVAPHGMHLIEDALRGTAPTHMVAPKAYEMMSCFEGLCEFYRITGDRRVFDAVLRFAQTIRKTELMVNGSASNQELWCRGAETQTAVLEQPQETCVTSTWIKLCAQLLTLTGDSTWADEIEVSVFNALAGAQTPNGDWWSYYSPLTGQRVPSLSQYKEIGLSCCVANGPRSLLLFPSLAVMEDSLGPVVNFYVPGRFPFTIPGGAKATLVQETTYPAGDQIVLTVEGYTHRAFTISLRIPAWSERTSLRVNGETIPCAAGGYAKIRRVWTLGDRIELKFDLRGRAVTSPGSRDHLAVMRGPILLALDNRLTPPGDVDVWLLADKDGYVDLKPSNNPPPDVWMTFYVPFEVRPYHFFRHHVEILRMCDYASAGNAWSAANLYRTWLPQPLYLKDLYVSDTWKLIYPDATRRPEIPNAI